MAFSLPLTCKYHKLRSRRRKEAEAQLTRNGTPPYVGAYSLSAIQSACEVFGLKTGESPTMELRLATGLAIASFCAPDEKVLWRVFVN